MGWCHVGETQKVATWSFLYPFILNKRVLCARHLLTPLIYHPCYSKIGFPSVYLQLYHFSALKPSIITYCLQSEFCLFGWADSTFIGKAWASLSSLISYPLPAHLLCYLHSHLVIPARTEGFPPSVLCSFCSLSLVAFSAPPFPASSLSELASLHF